MGHWWGDVGQRGTMVGQCGAMLGNVGHGWGNGGACVRQCLATRGNGEATLSNSEAMVGHV